MILQELISELRNIIGDNNKEEPNIIDDELKTILNTSASIYSRIKNVLKSTELPYDKTEEFYDVPDDCYKVKKVLLKELGVYLNFTDNLTQIILENLPDVDSGTLKITYSRYFSPEDINEKELDIYLLYAEALCYKLMASKTAELIKFSSGEKIVDESLISDKYLKLFKETEKIFKSRVIKAYGKRADNMLENLDYDLKYPTLGETP